MVTGHPLSLEPVFIHAPLLSSRWYVPQNIPKILFTDGGESSIVRDCTREYKINFEGFPENGCYGNQPQSLEVLYESINSNNSCSFTKQDLIFKQACLVCFCVVLYNKRQF